MRTILVDVDGVLADFTPTYLHELEKATGRHYIEADVTDFDFRKCVCTAEEDAAVWRTLSETPGIVYNLPTYPGAFQFLKELRELGRVVACTKPAGPRWAGERYHWLLDCGFAPADIVLCGDKNLVKGDVLIDDCIQNLDEWEHGPGILVERPWNMLVDSGYVLHGSYAQILQTVYRLPVQRV
jgi:5'(3')-deoxyribonucleotidase